MNMRKLPNRRSYPAECVSSRTKYMSVAETVRSTAARKQLRKYNNAPTCIRGHILSAVRVNCILSDITKLVNA